MGKHILIATEANEGLGHIAPWKALIEQLLSQGDQVTFACPQPAQARAVLSLPTVRYEPILWPSMHTRPAPLAAHSWGELLTNLGYASHKAVAACLQRWLQLMREVQPDALIADYAPLAMLAAKTLQLPIIEAGGGFCLPPSDSTLALLLPTALSHTSEAPLFILAKAQQSSQQVAQACNAALQSQASTLRLSALTDLYTLASHRCITSSSALDPYHTTKSPRSGAMHIGPLAQAHTGRAVQDTAPTWAQAPAHITRILCYLKPNTPELAVIEQVLQQQPKSQVLAAGWAPHNLKPNTGLTQGHLKFASDTVDFMSALLLADVFITNGGLHSLSWALHHQCQCILLPTQAEQAATALHLAGHPQVTVCVDAKSLGLALKQMGKKQSSPALGKLAAGDNAEAILFRIIQRDITHVNTRQINHAIEY